MTQTVSDAQGTEAAIADVLASIVKGERRHFARHCLERGVSMGHLHILAALDERGPLPMSRVAELLGSGLPTATGFVSRMEKRGLVSRTHGTADRRIVLVHLTESGAAHLREIADLRRRRLAAALLHLDPAQRRSLLDALVELRSALERTSEGASA